MESQTERERIEFGRALADIVQPDFPWDSIQQQPLFNESWVICKMADGWDYLTMSRFLRKVDRQVYQASDMEPAEYEFALAVDYLMQRVGYARLASLVRSHLS